MGLMPGGETALLSAPPARLDNSSAASTIFIIMCDVRDRAATVRERSAFGKFPYAQRVPSQDQLAILRGIKIQRLIHERQFLIHRQLPARLRIPCPPDQLLRPELFVHGLEEG